MKFEIEITDKEFKALKDELASQDMDVDVPDEKIIAELFFIDDRYGNAFDVRDKLKIKKI